MFFGAFCYSVRFFGGGDIWRDVFPPTGLGYCTTLVARPGCGLRLVHRRQLDSEPPGTPRIYFTEQTFVGTASKPTEHQIGFVGHARGWHRRRCRRRRFSRVFRRCSAMEKGPFSPACIPPCQLRAPLERAHMSLPIYFPLKAGHDTTLTRCARHAPPPIPAPCSLSPPPSFPQRPFFRSFVLASRLKLIRRLPGATLKRGGTRVRPPPPSARAYRERSRPSGTAASLERRC